jgi:hypothetical protein
MTNKNIERYLFSSEYLKQIERWKYQLPFKEDFFECIGNPPKIEQKLDKIHREMHTEIVKIIMQSRTKVKKIIHNI